MGKPKKAKAPLTERELVQRIEAKFPAPQFATMPQVRNGTGYRRVARTADALSMSLWPSRGLGLHGFECKTYRNDWLRELQNPEKAEEMFSYCSHWWIVVGDESIVQDGELPPTWGLLIPRGKGLSVKVDAPALDPKPLDRVFVASICRNIQSLRPDQKAVSEAIESTRADMEAAWKRRREFELDHAKEKLATLREKVGEFERASGVRIENGWDLGGIGNAVKLLREADEFAFEKLIRAAEVLGEAAKEAVAVRNALGPRAPEESDHEAA